MSIRKINFSVLFVAMLCTSCSGTKDPYGQEYSDAVIPGKTVLLNWTGQPTTTNSAELYFSASQRTEMFVKFQDRLLAIQVDDKDLPGANRGLVYPTGYQAIALSPGVHSVSYCHMTRSALATGVGMCDFKIKDFNFKANTRYMLFGDTSVESIATGQKITVKTRLVNCSISTKSC